LYAEIEDWDDANESAFIHVKVPTVYSSKNTNIYMYYDVLQGDNTTYIGDTADAAAHSVWDSDFRGVFHLNNFAAGVTGGSTSNGEGGTGVGGAGGSIVDALSGKGMIFDPATSDRFDLNTPWLAGSTYTVEAIIKLDAGVSSAGVVYGHSNAGNESINFLVYVHTGTYFMHGFHRFNPPHVWYTAISTATIAHSTWYYISGSQGTQVVAMVNGADKVTDPQSGGSNDASNRSYIGQGGDFTPQYFDGTIAEVRISTSERSDAWRKTTYYTLFDNLFTFGSEQT